MEKNVFKIAVLSRGYFDIQVCCEYLTQVSSDWYITSFKVLANYTSTDVLICVITFKQLLVSSKEVYLSGKGLKDITQIPENTIDSKLGVILFAVTQYIISMSLNTTSFLDDSEWSFLNRKQLC